MVRTLLVALVVLSGCASTRVVPIGPDTYMLQHQGASGFVGNNSVRMDAYDDASKYCSSMEKHFLVVSSSDSPAGPFRYPSTDIQFRCLNKSDPDLRRPTLEPVADTTIEVKKN